MSKPRALDLFCGAVRDNLLLNYFVANLNSENKTMPPMQCPLRAFNARRQCAALLLREVFKAGNPEENKALASAEPRGNDRLQQEPDYQKSRGLARKTSRGAQSNHCRAWQSMRCSRMWREQLQLATCRLHSHHARSAISPSPTPWLYSQAPEGIPPSLCKSPLRTHLNGCHRRDRN